MLLLVLVVALAIGVHRHGQPSLAQRERTLASQFRCPVCQGESVEQSQSPVSTSIRQLIDRELAAGRRPSAIRRQLVASYGPSILERPSTEGAGWAVWLVPALAVGAAIIGLSLAYRRMFRRAGLREPMASDEDRELVQRALAQSSTSPPPAPQRSPSQGTGGADPASAAVAGRSPR